MFLISRLSFYDHHRSIGIKVNIILLLLFSSYSRTVFADDQLDSLVHNTEFWRFMAIFLGLIQFLIIIGLLVFSYKKAKQTQKVKDLHQGLTEKTEQLSQEHQLLRSLMDNLPHLISFKNRQGEYIEFNSAFSAFVGKTRSQIEMHNESDIFKGKEADSVKEQDKLVMNSGVRQQASSWMHNATGQIRLMSISKIPLRTHKGGSTGILSISQDITEQHQKETIYQHRNKMLEQIAEATPLTEVFNSLIQFTEEAFPGLLCSILLLDKTGRLLQIGAAPSLPDFYNEAVHNLAIGNQVGSCGTAAFTGRPIIVTDIDTHPYWQDYKALALKAGLKSCWSIPIKNRQAKVLGTFALYYREIAEPNSRQLELMHANAQLASIAIEADRMDQQLHKLSLAVESSASSVMITDAELNIEYVNPSLVQTSGYGAEELIGRKAGFLSGEEKEAEIIRDIWSTVFTGKIWRGERMLRKKNGDCFWVMSSTSPIKNQAGEITHLVSVSEDITLLKQDHERMEMLAFYDPLTGLANRRLFKDRLDMALKKAIRQQSHVALLYLDLDHFKAVNDQYGHDAGDNLLKEVAERLRVAVRDSDIVSRIGGDEFNIILHDLQNAEDSELVANKILSSVIRPIDIGNGISVTVSASIGITLAPDDGIDAKKLIKNADVAMYQSKQLGRNQFMRYKPPITAEG